MQKKNNDKMIITWMDVKRVRYTKTNWNFKDISYWYKKKKSRIGKVFYLNYIFSNYTNNSTDKDIS